MKKILLSVTFAVCFGVLALSQNIDPVSMQFTRLTSENQILQRGLSQNTVYCIIQDKVGYMWFGTWDGLNKYDGYQFTVYKRQNGLSDETVHALLEDEKGRIWIGTEAGLNCLDPVTGKIKVFLHDPASTSSLSGDKINYLFQDIPGKVWVCTASGLNLLDIQTGKVFHYNSRFTGERSSPANDITFICKDSRGFYWIGSHFGVVRSNPSTRESVRYLHRPGDESSLSCNHITCIFEDSAHHIYIGTEKGLNLFNEENGTFRRMLYQQDEASKAETCHITSILDDDEGNLWVTTDGNGVKILNGADSVFSILNDPKNRRSINNNRVYDMFRDKIGNLWFGTMIGVAKLNKYSADFELFLHNPSSTNSVRNNIIWSFLEYKPGVFWVSTEDGISIYDRPAGRFSRFEDKYPFAARLVKKRVWAFSRDYTGGVWIGTEKEGLYFFDGKNRILENHRPSSQEKFTISGLNIHALLEDSNRQLWVGTNNGLDVIDLQTKTVKVFRHDPGDDKSIAGNTVYDILEDEHGNIWLAASNGLCRYDKTSDSFDTYSVMQQNNFDLLPVRFFSIFEDANGDFWLGSRESGLFMFDKEKKVFKSFTTKDGLPDNMVYNIIEDDEGFLWLNTNWGISRFDRQNDSFLNFDVTDGLQSNEFNSNASLKSSSGLIFFGGMKGFNVFDPARIKLNTNVPEIVITGFKILNREQPGELFPGDTIRLNHKDNFFTFVFAAMDYTNPLKNHFSYKLENYNRDWIDVTAGHHFANFTKVEPGNYVFRVIGSNNNNVWNREGTAIHIIITPPWHQTWFFKIALAIIIIGAIWLFLVFRIRHIRRKHEIQKKVLQIEKQLFEIQQKALRLQMNPHFIFNSLNSIQSYILSNDTDLAVNYLGRFSQLMRLILSNSRESLIPLADELHALKLYIEIEQLRFENKFTYEIVVDPSIDEEFTGVPPMIIQPYVENAIIHGLVHKPDRGHLKLQFTQQGPNILCLIEDDGIGRDKATEIKRNSGINTESKGMMITNERIEILREKTHKDFDVKIIDLKDNKGNPAGTRVELVIAIQEM
jgi:ligand-binding sensor domain-containing protein